MAAFKRWVSEATMVSSAMPSAYYNSALTLDTASTTTNAELTIYLRVLMRKVTTAAAGRSVTVPVPFQPGTTKQVPIQDWDTPGDPMTFEFFKRMVKWEADTFWNNTNLCLVPPRDYRGLYWPPARPTHQLNINCRFEVVWASGYHDAHIVIDNTRISGPHDTYTITSSMQPFPTGGSPDKFGNRAQGFLDSGDLFALSTPGGVPTVGTTIPHEIGHALGLPHIGVQSQYMPCMYALAHGGDGNMPVCYVGASSDDANNIMGMGNGVSTRNSLPWLRRIPSHTSVHVLDWKVASRQIPPHKL